MQWGNPQGLTDALLEASASDYVRIVASWLAETTDWRTPPTIEGQGVIGALVASASGHAALAHGEPEPEWTFGHVLDTFWHPGLEGMFAWSFAHTPASFKNRGIVIEADSLVSV